MFFPNSLKSCSGPNSLKSCSGRIFFLNPTCGCSLRKHYVTLHAFHVVPTAAVHDPGRMGTLASSWLPKKATRLWSCCWLRTRLRSTRRTRYHARTLVRSTWRTRYHALAPGTLMTQRSCFPWLDPIPPCPCLPNAGKPDSTFKKYSVDVAVSLNERNS